MGLGKCGLLDLRFSQGGWCGEELCGVTGLGIGFFGVGGGRKSICRGFSD